jgi:hypothetical protein
MKKILFTLYIVVILCMGTATFVEKFQGTTFVSTHIYGAWWFSALWALLTAFAIGWFVKQRVKRFFVVMLHLSFVAILAGALLTHLTGRQGMMHLRLGMTSQSFYERVGDEVQEYQLPFKVRLDRFEVKYHEGTNAASDYISSFTVTDGKGQYKGAVSMNNIFAHHQIRLYQSSYDDDGQGSYLSVNSDPFGIPVTYTGYALLFISLIWMLFDPKGSYQSVAMTLKRRHENEKRRGDRVRKMVDKNERKRYLYPLAILPIVILVVSLAIFLPDKKEELKLPTLPAETAAEFGKLNILYNDRICPLQTFAIDFTKKLYGKRHYKDYTA